MEHNGIQILCGPTTLNIPISEGGTNSSHTHHLAKFQRHWGLKLLVSDTKFMDIVNSMLFTIDFKKIVYAYEQCIPHACQWIVPSVDTFSA